LQILDSSLSWPPEGGTALTIRFGLEKGVEYKKLSLGSLRFYCHAEESIASIMHLFLTRHVSRVLVSAGESRLSLGADAIRPVGFAENEALLPMNDEVPFGCRLIHEYFSFRRKFGFVELVGLDRFVAPEKTTEFLVQISFNRPYPEEKRFKAENLRLHCTPIVNLFRADAEPIRLDHRSIEYRIIGSAREAKSVDVYSINSVVGTEDGTGAKHQFVPFYSYHHVGEGEWRYFITNSRIGPSDRPVMYLSAGGFGPNPVPETLSLDVMCTNGPVPREKVGERGITELAPDFPNVATFENLTQPTLTLVPPTLAMTRRDTPLEHYLWVLVSHFAFSRASVANAEALKGVLGLYDWTGTDANRRRINGIRSVRWEPREVIQRGAVLRGAEVTLEIQDGFFADEGDLCLFGLVLSEFLSQYATINAFVHLTFITKPSEFRFHWEPMRGGLPLV
jgi:type VI secretion system protein ImpG